MYMLTNHCSRVLFCVLSLTCCSLAVHTLCKAWVRTDTAALVAVCATITII